MTAASRALLGPGIVEREILVVRGHQVILDEQLAPMYGVEVKVLNQAVKRNHERFPEDLQIIGYSAVSAWRQQSPPKDRKPVAWARATAILRDALLLADIEYLRAIQGVT